MNDKVKAWAPEQLTESVQEMQTALGKVDLSVKNQKAQKAALEDFNQQLHLMRGRLDAMENNIGTFQNLVAELRSNFGLAVAMSRGHGSTTASDAD